MAATMENPPPSRKSIGNRQVVTVRGQRHQFLPIPLMEENTRWFDAGPISIGVEARALGDRLDRMVRGPSIHVFNAKRDEEYIRFDIFGRVLHYHYILNEDNANILWGYDPDMNGPMLNWAIDAMRDRMPLLLINAGAHDLAREVRQSGWDSSVLDDVAKAASAALAPSDDDLVRAKAGMDWMYRWKAVHPQFNTVEGDDY